MRNPIKLLPLSLALLLAPTFASADDLLQIYDQARQNDPTLKIAKDTNLSIGENVDIATSALLPQISASYAFTDSHGSSTSQQPVQDDNGNLVLIPYTSSSSTRGVNWGGRLDQSILDFSRWTARKAAKEQALRSDSQYVQAEQDLAIRVATAYFTVLTNEDSVTFSEAEEKALERQLDQAQQRFEVGLSAITDVNEAKAQYDSARAATINARNALDDAREALREITGKEPGALLRLREKLPLTEPVPNDMQVWVDKAIAENPGLKAQELALAAANTNIKTQRAGHLPTLSGSITYNNQPSWGDRTVQGRLNPINNTGSDTAIGLSL
ncbi:MAG TPA: TolC family protein, partial [Tahibacter sp.]|nr:TolC family protein [Tahibacter sp.]